MTKLGTVKSNVPEKWKSLVIINGMQLHALTRNDSTINLKDNLWKLEIMKSFSALYSGFLKWIMKIYIGIHSARSMEW